ncbi:MAG: right-handed parallel beta-helix repeat-containing protein, partial [Planctomycetes bacterium]|nr:right-handed parallel beta-helix repeat-containing protein [Planctomycetota bacterium]
SSSSAVVENSVLVDNAASGVSSRFDSGVVLSHCTISGNGSPLSFVGGESLLRNTIVFGDRADGNVSMSLKNQAIVTVEYCDVAGGVDAVSMDESATLEWGAGNIDFEPRFVDPDGADDDLATWDDNDYHLSPHSVCVEAGDPAFVESADQTDVDGDPRLWFDVVDIGADEANEFLDCNTNLTLDAHDIAFAGSTDCNDNGIPDECDIANTVSTDCDGNALPDECDVSAGFAVEFPPQSPFGGAAPQAFLVPSPPAAYGDVRLTVAAAADLNGTAEFVDIRLNGIRVASVFQNAGTACGDPADVAT